MGFSFAIEFIHWKDREGFVILYTSKTDNRNKIVKDYDIEYRTTFQDGKLISSVVHVYQMLQWEMGAFVYKPYPVVVRISVN